MSDNSPLEKLRQKLTDSLNPTQLDIINEDHQHKGHVSQGGHFALVIVSEHFTNCTLLQRHRMVYAAVGDLMQTAIHALSIKAYTPDEWTQKSITK